MTRHAAERFQHTRVECVPAQLAARGVNVRPHLVDKLAALALEIGRLAGRTSYDQK